MLELTEYNKAKADLEKLIRQRDRVAGAFDQLKTQLQKEFGCKTIAQAKKKLKLLRQEQIENEKTFKKALRKFLDEFDKFIEQSESARAAKQSSRSRTASAPTRKKKRQAFAVAPLGLE